MKNIASGFKDLRFEETASLKPRDRILKTAIILFNERGVHTIGIDRIIAESGVSKRTFYNYFPSKADLIAAYLDFWHWLRFTNLNKYATRAGGDPKAELLAIFDFLEYWFSEQDFRGCAFARGLNDFNDDASKILRAKVGLHFDEWENFIKTRLSQLVEPDKAEVVLPQFLSLITGTTVVAHASGNIKIAQLNKQIAEALLSERAV
ncbi:MULTISPECIES: TetR/AcrR family transcriptional regulator [unclassified Pseudomonas]|jgi:AcrR family transcriptional regulator|uniref:TetR/AcrR family transcriptional regulator n=1 Tax=Pseudomonas sp. A-R-26 TaxID=2832404 RepID=UPI001CBC93CA|nr:TetR/AcrR family transcriptional regulator [Pseudomonas sp. A-R-26]